MRSAGAVRLRRTRLGAVAGPLSSGRREAPKTRTWPAPLRSFCYDGELDRVRVILERLGADFALCRRVTDPSDVPAPRDLLVTSGRRALEMSDFAGRLQAGGGPIWLCVHGQDFGEVRAQLRGLGVNYLVHSAVDQESLRLLIEMLLHGRSERRTASRLPVGFEVTLRCGRQTHFAKLLDLSRRGARLRSEVSLEVGDRVEVDLPLELRGSGLSGLAGRVGRIESSPGPGGRSDWSIGLELEALSEQADRALEEILSGSHPATRISALAPKPTRERRVPSGKDASPRSRLASAAAPSGARTGAGSQRSPLPMRALRGSRSATISRSSASALRDSRVS